MSAPCCLCGLPYEAIGNNPSPLAPKGRCCDACNEVVTEARINVRAIAEEIDRVESAMLHKVNEPLQRIAIAAICASRGPRLWAEKRRLLAQVRSELAGGTDDEG
jgi:hypothetical protein